MVSAAQNTNTETTTTQFIEYLFDDEQEDDWVDETHSFEHLSLVISTRYSGVGISRVSLFCLLFTKLLHPTSHYIS